jgi:AraC family transcriptional activator of pobA
MRPAIRPITFDRHKYGPALQVDACSVRSIPGFIKTPEVHRLGFYEIALVTDGRGQLDLGGVPVDVAPYRLCLTRPGEARRWRLDGARLDGSLAFFEAAFVDDFFADPCFVERLPVMSCAPGRRSIALSRRQFDALVTVVGEMGDELADLRSDSGDLLRAQVHRLLVMVQRANGTGPAAAIDPATRLAARFSKLMAGGASAGRSVAEMASSLGTTPRALNRCLRETCGRTAGELMQQHVLRESRRLLLRTELSVAAIAERLNFSDPSYFSRFFKRHLGLPPGSFRERQKSAVADANVHCEVEIDR